MEHPILALTEPIHDEIQGAIARGDWPAVVEGLDKLGQVHSEHRTGFARMTYRRALRIAQEHDLTERTPDLEEKLKKEGG